MRGVSFQKLCGKMEFRSFAWMLPFLPLLLMTHAEAAAAAPKIGSAAWTGLGMPPADFQFQPLTWEAAYEAAEKLLPWMEPSEKLNLIRGIGWERDTWSLRKWWYVGNTAGVPRLNIPSLNLQDAAGGFRTYWHDLVGSVTVWPSQLALAATWNPTTVRKFAVALGKEFVGKGANAILGPSIEVHRVAKNGRNFEYLSGEDPYLGSKLAEEYVKGVQSQGVLAVMKHFALNHQEFRRRDSSSNVDEKTMWELYMPPFKAAIDAGVSAAMCSYNQINGTYSCGNEYMLKTVLKDRMGFKGFVQTDWWALDNNKSLSFGLDQDMPGWPVESLYSDSSSSSQLSQATPESVDKAAKRILASMLRMKLEDSTQCAPPHCKERFLTNVTSAQHSKLARDIAAESIVLLKNDGNVLPLSSDTVKTIAIIGAAASAAAYDPNGKGQTDHPSTVPAWAIGDYYSGGGSGHVTCAPHQLVKPVDGLRRRAEELGITVITSTTNNVSAAVAAAAQADVAIVVAATTSGESIDRSSLYLDDGADKVIAAVAASDVNRTVVLTQIPGVILMPWKDSVDAILSMFLGGQSTGDAWADVVFGDRAPTGRLPVMMPVSEADTIEPSTSHEINYTEGLATSYRSRSFRSAFPFGHGLSYTEFQYAGLPEQRPCSKEESGLGAEICIRQVVKNVGEKPGSTVAQLYLEFPSPAGHPRPFLKGFERTAVMMPGDSTNLTFKLTRRALSYYDADRMDWTLSLSATAHIGESSADIRQVLILADLPTTTTTTTMATTTTTITTKTMSKSAASTQLSGSRRGTAFSGSFMSFVMLVAISGALFSR